MKKTKILSLLLSLSLFCTLIAPGTTAYAEGKTKPGSDDNGMKISKTATANTDGSYTIKLEAFATGEKTTQTTDVPTDIVLVLDQSGSMGDDMGTVKYTPYTGNDTQNQSNYAKRHNDGTANLWYKLDDDSYVSVSVTKTTTYNALDAKLPNYKRRDECYWKYKENLYEKVGDEYKKVELDSEYVYFQGDYRYTYTFADGTTVVSDGNGTEPNLGRHAPLYTPVADGNDTVYTYTYTDSTGAVQTIGTSTGASTSFTPAFYKRSTTSGGGTRIAALKTAATTFANAVAEKAAGADHDITTIADNIDHRIAVVGFASQSGYGDNTELLSIKGSNSGSVGVAYNNITDQDLKDVLQSMDKQAGQKMVTDAINALTANGATRTDLGMDMANRILEKNPLVNNETRNRVMIVFTDGSPTSGNGFEKKVAQNAIDTAKTIKDGGTTVYSIGIFSGADASTAGKEPDKDYTVDLLGRPNYTEAEMSAASNWFMQKVSSNNGTPQQPSYYLSAGDAASLNSIFQQISSNIGGSSTTLDDKTVVKDVISPYFTLPENATESNIELETYACTGKNANGDYTWSKNTDAMGAKASISGDQVSVTGFDFSQNWCGTETDAQGTTYRGNKLVISFKVQPKEDFLGGNDVYTNTNAGIYENSNAKEPIMTFDRPTVNVPIKKVTVKADDKNVYLKGAVTADQLKNGATVKVGGVALDLSKADQNYGLESWQTEYVDIAVKVMDKDGHEISADSLKNLTEDTTYTVEVIVSPKTDGKSSSGTPVTEKPGTNGANINVFKPELTFKDSEAYYGENVPASNDYSSNKVSEKWTHNGTEAVPSEMLGSKPMLNITYTPEASKLNSGKYTKQDVPVSATVKIGTTDVNQHTTFVHQNCTPDCGWENPATPGDPAFLIHVKTCTLNITKQGGADDESYVFDVYKGNEKYSEVTIWGTGTQTLFELPVGTYTISEDTGWSWRYKADNGSSAVLKADSPNGSITCTNTKTNDQWLNGFSTVRSNIFGTSHPSN